MKQVAAEPTCFMLVSCLAYSSTSKVEATCSSEMSVNFQQTTVQYMSEGKLFIIDDVSASNPATVLHDTFSLGHFLG
jgi:hypothetical protein